MREFLEFELSELKIADTLFHRLSKIDPANVPEKYGSAVSDARDLLMSRCTVKAVFSRLPVIERTDNRIITSDGICIEGEMLPRVLENSDGFYCFVVTLDGFSEVTSSDMMVQFFADTWGSAFVEAGHIQLVAMINKKLEEHGLSRTHVWSPGQHSFELSNQVPIFKLLKPENIGCTLTPSMLMMPVKSSSGVFGIIPADTIVNLKPCDFCQFRTTCPNSASGKCTSI